MYLICGYDKLRREDNFTPFCIKFVLQIGLFLLNKHFLSISFRLFTLLKITQYQIIKMNTDVDSANACKFCNKSATQKCSRCHMVYYCSKECQLAHHKTHKQICKLVYEIVDIPGKGKGMVARKSIPAGSLILSESPIIVSDIITGMNEMSSHWKNLCDTVSNLNTKKKNQFLSLHNPRPDLQLLGQFGSNSITIPVLNTNSAKPSTPKAAIFPTLSRINHSCAPNVVWSWNQERNKEELRGIVDLDPGTEMMASYVNVLLPSHIRKEELSYKYNFNCQCSVCSLPPGQLKSSDGNRRDISDFKSEIKEMIKWGQTKHAYVKSLDVLKIAIDLGFELYSVLPQMYLDSYQLCCKFYGDHSTNEEAIDLFDKGRKWAIRLRGNNTIFSKLERPVINDKLLIGNK